MFLIFSTFLAPLSKSATSNKPPTFLNVAHWHHLYLSDNDVVGTMLGRIEASDPDNDPLWFRITDESSNPNETFAFQSNGELVLARRAELIGNDLRKIELTISVSDGFAEIRDKVNSFYNISYNYQNLDLYSCNSFIICSSTF